MAFAGIPCVVLVTFEMLWQGHHFSSDTFAGSNMASSMGHSSGKVYPGPSTGFLYLPNLSLASLQIYPVLDVRPVDRTSDNV